MTLLDGKLMASQIRDEVKTAVSSWTNAAHPPPFLSVILVGDNPASATYVRAKTNACKKAGIGSETIQLSTNVTEDELLNVIKACNQNPNINGILVQLPLPNHISELKVLEAIDPKKDVDGFHPINKGHLSTNSPYFVPATPAGIIEMLKRAKISLNGKHAVVVGRSAIVGRPTATLLLNENATVTICHSRTQNLSIYTQQADILIAAVGIPNFITADMLKPNAVVIDVGINRIFDAEGNPKLVGDVDFESAKKVASAITPVPGGVGPMTIALLLKNTLHAATLQVA